MKKNILFGAVLLMAGTLLAADSTPKDDATAAAKKLADSSNYSWKVSQDFGPNAPFTPGPVEGKTEKGGLTYIASTFQDNTSIGVSKEKKVIVKTEDGWKTAEEIGDGGGQPNFDVFMARRMQNLKTPSDEVLDLVSKTSELKKDGDVISGNLTKEGAESLLTFFGRRAGGANRPAPKDAKGTLKIWLKDGAIVKYETKVTGKVDRNGEEVDSERNTVTEIRDVGTTKIELPDDAKKKLS